jgi:hypothetical protein
LRIALWIFVVGVGCSSERPTETGDDTTTNTVPEGPLCEVAQSDVVPSVFFLNWSGPEGESFVQYGQEQRFDKSTPRREGQDHSIAVLGLKAGGTYQLKGVTETPDGNVWACEAIEVVVPYPPAELIRFTVTEPADPTRSELTDGYVLTTLIQTDTAWAVMLDQDADYVWWYPMPKGAIAVTSLPSLDGTAFMWGEYDREKAADIGVVRRVRLDGTEEQITRTYLGHHAFIEHADGTLGWLALAFDDVDVSPSEDRTDFQLIASDRILEAPLGHAEEKGFVEQFNMFDDSGMTVWLECGHQQADFDRYGYFDIHEWTHTNSFAYLPEQDAYFLYSKYTDSLLKIQRSPEPGGRASQVWQMSGLEGDFTHPNGDSVWRETADSDLWSHGHLSHVWEGGFVVFDNQDHGDPEVSRIVEYAYDEEAMTVEQVFVWPDPDGDHTPMMGDVRKLPGGNYLAGWSSLGRINEIDPASGDKVWEIQGDLGVVAGRVYPIPDPYDTHAW